MYLFQQGHIFFLFVLLIKIPKWYEEYSDFQKQSSYAEQPGHIGGTATEQEAWIQNNGIHVE